MMLLKGLLFFLVLNFLPVGFSGLPHVGIAQAKTIEQPRIISSHKISLKKRYSNSFVNDVFKDNILLNIAYMENKVDKKSKIDWEKITRPFHYELSLKPNEVFAFHDSLLPQYKEKVIKTTNSHFNSQEQFKSDGYLFGDGVCHLASLIYWVAKDAKLDALAPRNHNFAFIPEIPKEFGVAIYSDPNGGQVGAFQNLYITNNKNSEIVFDFDYDGENLKISVTEEVKKLAFKN